MNGWLNSWWEHEIVMGHKGPLLTSFIAFLTTFLTTRTVTRLIRAGKGPFRNLSAGGTHLHHSTPGTILLIFGAFLAVGQQGQKPLNYLAAVLVGMGASLVLDEFAMIFHLQDVYWAREGQLSVNAVCLAAATLGLAIVGVSPAQVPHLDGDAAVIRWCLTFGLLIHLGFVAVTVLKGKYAVAIVSVVCLPLAWFAAVRLARPKSLWADMFYGPKRKARATRRQDAFDKQWGPLHEKWIDFIGGAPSQEQPPVTKKV